MHLPGYSDLVRAGKPPVAYIKGTSTLLRELLY